MKKLISVFIVMVSLPMAASAQAIPKVTLFGGYTLVRNQQPNGGANFNVNGWDASVEMKPASWLGLVGDVSQQYGSPSGIQERQTSVLFGPQITVPGLKKVKPFAHILVGAVHGTNQQSFTLTPCILGSFCGPRIVLGTTFATAVGGGVDFKLAGPVWVRAIQVDYLHANLNPDHHTQMRVAAGIAFHF